MSAARKNPNTGLDFSPLEANAALNANLVSSYISGSDEVAGVLLINGVRGMGAISGAAAPGVNMPAGVGSRKYTSGQFLGDAHVAAFDLTNRAVKKGYHAEDWIHGSLITAFEQAKETNSQLRLAEFLTAQGFDPSNTGNFDFTMSISAAPCEGCAVTVESFYDFLSDNLDNFSLTLEFYKGYDVGNPDNAYNKMKQKVKQGKVPTQIMSDRLIAMNPKIHQIAQTHARVAELLEIPIEDLQSAVNDPFFKDAQDLKQGSYSHYAHWPLKEYAEMQNEGLRTEVTKRDGSFPSYQEAKRPKKQ